MRFSTASIMTSLVAALAVQAAPTAGSGSGALAARAGTEIQTRGLSLSGSVQEIEAIATILEINSFSESDIINVLLNLGFTRNQLNSFNFNDGSLSRQFGNIFSNDNWVEVFEAISSNGINVEEIVTVIESSSNSLNDLFRENEQILEEIIQQNEINIFENVLRSATQTEIAEIMIQVFNSNSNILIEAVQLIQSGGSLNTLNLNLCDNASSGSSSSSSNVSSVGGYNSTASAVKSKKH
ncbi:hypothetical protein B7463_g7466, partial [Scytalidium lignicola]